MTIGVIVPEIKQDFFSSAISGIDGIEYKAGCAIFLCQSIESFDREVINSNFLCVNIRLGLSSQWSVILRINNRGGI